MYINEYLYDFRFKELLLYYMLLHMQLRTKFTWSCFLKYFL